MARSFNDSIEYYERVQALTWYRHLLESFVQFIEPERSNSVLCVGCGPGLLTRQLAKSVRTVVGVDGSASMIKRARELAPGARFKNVSYQTAPLDDLPFPDESYDRVIAAVVVSQIDKPSKVADEMARVASPGATVAIMDPSIEMRPDRFRMHVARQGITGFAFEAFYNWMGAAEQGNRFSRIDVERLCEKAGLNNISIKEEFDHMVLMAKGRRIPKGERVHRD